MMLALFLPEVTIQFENQFGQAKNIVHVFSVLHQSKDRVSFLSFWFVIEAKSSFNVKMCGQLVKIIKRKTFNNFSGDMQMQWFSIYWPNLAKLQIVV